MTETMEKIQALIDSHQRAVQDTFNECNYAILHEIVRELLKAFKAGNKVILCGNGGSAADSQHIAAEFVVRFHRERQSLPAIALSTDTSILTATANDYDFSRVFARQVEGLGITGDVLIALSTSGNSANVVEAVKTAKTKGILTIGFTNQDGGVLRQEVDICFCAGSKDTPHVQEMHITALHAISEVVESSLFA